jgi:hypothetical protein
MDLSENEKCLFTSLQYVESSHAPYQRIRFFCFWLLFLIDPNWWMHTQLLLLYLFCQISPLFWHTKFHKPEM